MSRTEAAPSDRSDAAKPEATAPGTPPAERRRRLAEKGRLLAERACGGGPSGGCAEGFARYHIERGEAEVARDLLRHLDQELEALGRHDPHGRRAPTEALAARIRGLLNDPGGSSSHARPP